MDIYANIGTATVAGRGFLPLAVEAGVCEVVDSLLSGLAMDIHTLTIELKNALAENNLPLAAALNIDTVAAIIGYMNNVVGSAMPTSALPEVNLPTLLDEDGPASVAAGWNAEPGGQLNITFNEPPAGYTAEIYVDGVFAKHSTIEGAGGWANDALLSAPAGTTTIRVLFRDPDDEQTRFGMIAAL
jgi:hypothetical protein